MSPDRPDATDDGSDATRRRILLGLGSAATVGLAGCTGDGGDGGDEATATPTATEMGETAATETATETDTVPRFETRTDTRTETRQEQDSRSEFRREFTRPENRREAGEFDNPREEDEAEFFSGGLFADSDVAETGILGAEEVRRLF